MSELTPTTGRGANGRVLLAVAEPVLLAALVFAFEQAGFDPACCLGSSAVATLLARGADLVLLELASAEPASIDACRASAVPLIVVGESWSERQCVQALDAGADDYLAKPLSVSEVLARARAVLRRRDRERAVGTAGTLSAGGLTLDLVRRQVEVNGVTVRLTPTESALLAYLAEQPGTPRTRVDIMRHLRESRHVGDERACDVHIVHLRRKLEADARAPRLIVTVPGRGYMLDVR
jgi:two-component system KDP operon response regulator KdpE